MKTIKPYRCRRSKKDHTLESAQPSLRRAAPQTPLKRGAASKRSARARGGVVAARAIAASTTRPYRRRCRFGGPRSARRGAVASPPRRSRGGFSGTAMVRSALVAAAVATAAAREEPTQPGFRAAAGDAGVVAKTNVLCDLPELTLPVVEKGGLASDEVAIFLLSNAAVYCGRSLPMINTWGRAFPHVYSAGPRRNRNASSGSKVRRGGRVDAAGRSRRGPGAVAPRPWGGCVDAAAASSVRRPRRRLRQHERAGRRGRVPVRQARGRLPRAPVLRARAHAAPLRRVQRD